MKRLIVDLLKTTQFFWIVCFIFGCGVKVDPRVQSYRESLIKKIEPAGAVTIEEARQHIEENSHIVLIGKVGNKESPNWWQEGRATLVISEGFPGSDYNIGPDHDPQTCPFCKWKWKTVDSFAMVEFVTSDDSIIPIDTPTLLSVKPGDVVVVQGIGRLAEDGILTLSANGVFLR
ncbi:MAG: hypothetical protein FJ267_08965 [Planctomycetes bacterium]|nr:hypothetical protein [Planctomycetota bacterium]